MKSIHAFGNNTIASVSRNLFALPIIVCLILAMGSSATAQEPPNIVVIFTDDLGIGDLSCFGATKISTPNIDGLAKQGMTITEVHAAASLCSPSRYGLLTGRSPWRLHKKGNGYRVNADRMIIPSFLKESGYKSAAIGKWHLGYSKDWNKQPITGPLEAGFDYHFGVPSNHNDSTRVFIENHDIYGRTPGKEYKSVNKGKDLPEGVDKPRVEDQVDTMLTKKAVEFIQRNKSNPFFLYFTPCAPHTHVTPAAAFRGTSQAGLYGDHIQELDSHVGTILKTLDELNLADNTLVIFTSDNGSTPKDFKGTQGVNLNLADDSADIRKLFKTAKADAKKLGHVTNSQWRDGKGHPYEGGHRVPFIARWPGQIEPNSTSECTTNLTDLFATFAAIVDRELPNDAAEDSFSLLPVLTGKADQVAGRDNVFILGNGKDSAIAVCGGKWKLVVWYGDEKDKGHELYDLSQDAGELQNLAKDYPQVVKQLADAYFAADKAGRTRPPEIQGQNKGTGDQKKTGTLNGPSSDPPRAGDEVSPAIQESDDLASFRQITKGMKVDKVRQILKDLQFVSIGSGFAIDAYTLDDQSVVKIWYDKGRVIWMRHNDEPMIE